MNAAPHSTLKVMRQLKSGELTGKNLSPADRQRCVEMLMIEGVSVHEVADLMGMSEKTIRRDRAKIREHNAITDGHEAIGRFLGDYATQVDAAVSRLAKLGRDPAASVSEKIEAATAIPGIMDRFTERLIDLGLKSSDADRSGTLEELVRAMFVVVTDSGLTPGLTNQVHELIGEMDPDRTGGT